jgi:hypothetical protein
VGYGQLSLAMEILKQGRVETEHQARVNSVNNTRVSPSKGAAGVEASHTPVQIMGNIESMIEAGMERLLAREEHKRGLPPTTDPMFHIIDPVEDDEDDEDDDDE